MRTKDEIEIKVTTLRQQLRDAQKRNDNVTCDIVEAQIYVLLWVLK
jgi:hypothetical protein